MTADAPEAAGWRTRIVGTGSEAPDQLLANPRNWRIHPKAQQDALGDILDEVGWVTEVLVNRTTGHVVDGHLRVALAISRGEPSVPVKYVELSEAEEALVIATLDPLAALAATDGSALRELLREVEIPAGDLLSYLERIAGPADQDSPESFPSFGDHVETDVECPKCGYSWKR